MGSRASLSEAKTRPSPRCTASPPWSAGGSAHVSNPASPPPPWRCGIRISIWGSAATDRPRPPQRGSRMDDLTTTTAELAPEVITGPPRVPHPLYALKDRDTFLVTAASGDIEGAGDGLFHDDTRILSRFCLLLSGQPPSLLSASITQDNAFSPSHGANQAMPAPAAAPGVSAGPPGVLHVERRRLLL